MATIAIKEMGNTTNGCRQIVCVRQKDHAEVIRGWTVEAGTLHDQYALFGQQVISKLLIVFDRIHFWIKTGKHIQR